MDQETVLIVIHDLHVRDFLRETIRPAGYRVLTAPDGETGLEWALTEQPDVILLDLMLPRLPGLDLMRLLQKHNCHRPVIVLAPQEAERKILSAFHLGAKDFLQAPLTPEAVWAAVENALAEERLRRERENLTWALAQANQRLQQQIQHWRTLDTIAQTITSTLEESEIFRRVIQNITRILQIEACSLLLVDQETGGLELTVTLNENEAQSAAFRLEPGHSIADWVVKCGEPLLVPNIHRDPRCSPLLERRIGFQSRSILCVPLKARGRVIGVIEAINKQGAGEAFTEEDLKMLTALASWVAIAVENARLNRSARKMAATATLKQTVAAVAHHLNNCLSAFSLELDGLEMTASSDQELVRAIMASARQNIQDVSAIVNALDHLEEIHTVSYAGGTEMLDIGDVLVKEPAP